MGWRAAELACATRLGRRRRVDGRAFGIDPALALQVRVHKIVHVKQIWVELSDDDAKRLEQLAPARSRRRSEFVRMALRKALWEAEERATAEAYRRRPDSVEAYVDACVWEPKRSRPRTRRRR
jgi:predicted transcriptional regulator